MKKIAIVLIMALGLNAAAQQKPETADSAEAIVDRYMEMMEPASNRTDSILYMETYIYFRSTPHDTAIMKRWFLPPNRFRYELWFGDTLREGAYSDGKKVFREYQWDMLDGWTRVAESRYYVIVPGYDFRGPLYNWRANGSEMKYLGIWNFQGNKVYRVLMETPDKYNRYLLFEKESGLLFMIQETNEHSEYSRHIAYKHPDWHAYHEYQPVGAALLPSIESYQVDNDILFHFTRYSYIPLNMKIFTED